MVDGYCLNITGCEVEVSSECLYDFYYDGGEFKTLHVTPYDEESFELMTARVINGALVLYHLNTPVAYRGTGLGSIGVAFFYYLLETEGFDDYAIKFGGGRDSARFLQSLGFDDKYIHTAQDASFPGGSVMVGDFEQTGARDYDWALDPIAKDTFPTGFFKLV